MFEEYDTRYEMAQERSAGRRIIRRILDTLIYPNAKLILWLQTILPYFKSKLIADKIVKNAEYMMQPIVVVILWEKGILRSDIQNLLREAKKNGAYVLAVNTNRLHESLQKSELFDTYIERFNYGRDFGSFKTAILYLHKTYGLHSIPRLVLLNDSVFYLKKETQSFIPRMLNSDLDVLGVTENFEGQKHIGSFAISIGNHVLKSQHFRNFWRRYRVSDLRSKVIKRGEMKLTRALQKSISAQDQMDVMYSQRAISNFLQGNPNGIETLLSLVVNGRNHWRHFSMRQALEAWRSRYLFTSIPVSKGDFLNPVTFDEIIGTPLTFAEAVKEIKRLYPEVDVKRAKEQFYEMVRGALLLTSVSGSQIHHNGLIFHMLGCPLVKLDVIYRGAWSYEDAEKLLAKLDTHDALELKKLLYSRAYGEDSLRGWRRAAFVRGLI